MHRHRHVDVEADIHTCKDIMHSNLYIYTYIDKDIHEVMCMHMCMYTYMCARAFTYVHPYGTSSAAYVHTFASNCMWIDLLDRY